MTRPSTKDARARPVALIVDPDPATSAVFDELLQRLGFGAVRASSGAEAIEKFHTTLPSLVLLDVNLPDMTGRQLLRHLRSDGFQVPVVAMATAADLRMAVEATRNGANEFLDKSADVDHFRKALEAVIAAPDRHDVPARAFEPTERDRGHFFGQYDQIFRRSDRMGEIEKTVLQVADTNATVLIQGETGVGKELVAKALHYLSDRSARPWVKVNCASLPAELLESELFGHEKGAFTGAASRKPGRFEVANGGTFLLDEIGEMPLSLQSKILHVLQDNEFFRVGGRELISVDVRIIAATNKDIFAMVKQGSFREDLYYRLNVVSIVVPPLRDRPEEITSLVEYYRERFMRQFNRRTAELSSQTLDLLTAYKWPGNVRELENLIKRYVALGDEKHLRDELLMRMKVTESQPVAAVLPRAAVEPPPGHHFPAPDLPDSDLGLREIARRAAAQAEHRAIEEVLGRVQWNRAEAARRLKISYKTLLNKLTQGGFKTKPRRRRLR